MANLLPLKSVTDTQVQDVVRLALRDGGNAQILADFLASVDWSGALESTSGTAALLGRIENWTSLFLEGDMSTSEFKKKLLSTLSENPAGAAPQRPAGNRVRER